MLKNKKIIIQYNNWSFVIHDFRNEAKMKHEFQECFNLIIRSFEAKDHFQNASKHMSIIFENQVSL